MFLAYTGSLCAGQKSVQVVEINLKSICYKNSSYSKSDTIAKKQR